MERLSSGMRINRAGDDAAGLAISEKMRGQIRGLKQASRNAQDGISLIQTAEGALNETHSILQRMRELATQSATDTNTGVDRDEIQKEINQLAEEINRIAETTEFNTQNLLGGDFKAKFHIGANQGQNVELAINAMDAQSLKISGADGIALEVSAVVDNFDDSDLVAVDVAGNTYDVVKLDAETTVVAVDANYILADADGNAVAVSADGVKYNLLQAATAIADLGTAALATYGTSPAVALDAFDFGDAVTSGQVTFSTEVDGEITATGTHMVEFADASLASGTYTVVDNTHHLVDNYGLTNSKGDLVAVSADGQAWKNLAGEDLFTVSEANQFITAGVEITVSSEGGIDVSTQEAADKAITVLNDAIETVSAERSKLGAMQNRLEHTIANLGTSAENLQAAESRIRDLDMAEEIMAFTKNNILQQAATAMLAQANMAPQSVLQLLG